MCSVRMVAEFDYLIPIKTQYLLSENVNLSKELSVWMFGVMESWKLFDNYKPIGDKSCVTSGRI